MRLPKVNVTLGVPGEIESASISESTININLYTEEETKDIPVVGGADY